MKKYQEIETDTPETFKRMTGLSKTHFQDLCDKTEIDIKEEKKRNPLKRRGLKKSKLSLGGCPRMQSPHFFRVNFLKRANQDFMLMLFCTLVLPWFSDFSDLSCFYMSIIPLFSILYLFMGGAI
jgi:hypothetical protein